MQLRIKMKSQHGEYIYSLISIPFISKKGCSSALCLRDTQTVFDLKNSNSMCCLLPQSTMLQRPARIYAKLY